MATDSAKRDNIENKYRALDIATGDEPEPLFIFVSNGSRTDADELDSETDTASEGKVDSDIIDSKTDAASVGEVWD